MKEVLQYLHILNLVEIEEFLLLSAAWMTNDAGVIVIIFLARIMTKVYERNMLDHPIFFFIRIYASNDFIWQINQHKMY